MTPASRAGVMGAVSDISLGAEITAALDYHRDGSLGELVWRNAAEQIRAHTEIDYTRDGLRSSEKVRPARLRSSAPRPWTTVTMACSLPLALTAARPPTPTPLAVTSARSRTGERTRTP